MIGQRGLEPLQTSPIFSKPHRVAAGKAVLGEQYIATIEVDDFSDLEMLQMMAHENAQAYAEHVGHAMQCVDQAKRLLDSLVISIPSLDLPSKATPESLARMERRNRTQPGYGTGLSPHPGDLHES